MAGVRAVAGRSVWLLLTLFCLGGSASADVFDRIDRCESEGGGNCVFDLLRELARGGSRDEPGNVSCRCSGPSLKCSVEKAGRRVLFHNSVTLTDAVECGDMLKLVRENGRFCHEETLYEVDSHRLELVQEESFDSYGYCLLVATNDHLSGDIKLPSLTCRGGDRGKSYARKGGCKTYGNQCWFPDGGCAANGNDCWLPSGHCKPYGAGCYFDGRRISSKPYRCRAR